MPSSTHTVIGGTKRLECRVIGHPRPEIRWFKDGRDITHNSRYSFDHTYEGVISMIMENIGHKDEGHYRCRAENSEGIASTSAYLTVKAHKEHPDEEIEEVHTMELDEHVVYKTNRDHTIITEFPRDSKMDMEAARRRTFEQIVDEEKENVREILNGTVSKEFSSKKSSESSTIIESLNEKSYSKKTVEKYDETIESSSKRSLIISEEKTSLSFQSEIESAGIKTSKEESLSEFSSMEETKVKADLAEKEMVMKVSVETEQSSSSQSKSDRLTASIDSEINEKNKKQGLSVEVTEAETSSRLAKESAQEQGLSVEVTEAETSSMAAKRSAKEQGLSVEVTEAETSSRLAKEQGLSVEATEAETSSMAAKEQGLSVEVTETETSSRLAKEQGLSVEVTEAETSSRLAKEQGLSVEVTEAETSSRLAKEQGLSVEVTETETSNRETKESAKDLITSVSTEEVSTESSRRDEEKQKKLKVEVEVEEVPAECRMELERQDEEDDSAKSVTDSAPTSLCNDSGFMESSMLDSTQFQTDSMVDSAMDSSTVDTSATESETDTKTKTDSKTASLKKEISVEESRVEESTTSETSEITSLVEKSEKLKSEENVSAVAGTTSVTRQTSLVGEITEEELAESTTKTTSEITSLAEKSEKLKSEEDVSAAASAASVARQTSLVEEVTEEEPAESTTKTTSADEEAKAAEEVIRRESTSVSQEISHADETVENISGGDITGLLDERPDPTTVVEEEVVVAEAEEEEQQQEQRARWVDQITSRTEALTMEGEGKKVEELTPEEAAVATQTQVDQVELSRTTSEKAPATSVNAENLTARQSSVVDDLSQDQEQTVTVNTQASSKDQRRGYEDRLEVDEDISAQNVLGLQKAPRSTLDEMGSSVDSISQAGKEADAEPEVKKDEGLTVEAEVSTEESQKVTTDDDGLTVEAEVTTEESKKVTKDDEELRVSAEVSVSEREAQAGEARSAPRLVAVPEDVSVQLGQTIRLESQVQGNPQPEVKWFKSGDSLKAGERVTLHTDSDVFSLEIREAEEGDGGTYTLTAHNSEGTIFSDAVVTVTIPPSLGAPSDDITLRARVCVPEIVAQPGKVTVKEFGALELVCTIRGTPTPTVEWTTEGHTLQSDSHRSVFESEGQYYLTIPRVTAQDAGDYTCTASNSEGSVTCTISVFVESQGSSVSEDGAAAMVPLSQRESSSDDLFLRVYEVIRAYQDEETKVVLAVGDVVEVLDSKQKTGMWLVRSQTKREQVCFIPSSHLKEKGEAEADSSGKKKEAKQSRSPSSRMSSAEPLDWVDTSEDEDRFKAREKYPDYVVIADFNPSQVNGDTSSDWLKVTEGQVVEVMDMERSDRWLVQTRPTKTCTARQGWVPAAYLEPKAGGSLLQQRSTREVFREDVLQIANKQQEASLKRRYAITELVESEREYVRDLQKLLDSYYTKLGRRSTPAVLKDKRDLIFSNINDIMDFHHDVFLKILETSVANPGTIGDAFLVKERKFNMYVSYWIDHLSTKAFVETEEAQEFLREYSRSIGDSELTFPRLLECPILRLDAYQTLLKDVLRYTSRVGEDCSSLERAIAMLASVQQQVKHAQLLQNVEGLPDDASSLGQLVRHDDVITWDSDVSSTRAKERHLFLFKDKVVITKKKKGDSPTDQPTFVFKGIVELQNVQLNENVKEDERRFELWYASAESEKLTVQTKTLAAKQAWLKDTRELLRALGVEETDIMPEKTAEETNTQPTPVPVQKKKPADKPTSVPLDSGSESDRTLTDGDYASLSSFDDSDISSYHTAPEFEDGTTRPVFKKRPKKTVCQEGNTAKFDCIVGGNPLPSVRWLKDGATLKESDQIQVTSEGDTSTLTLLSVVSSQAGQYTALAANLNGSILSAAELVVLEELGLEKPEPSQDQEANGALEEEKTPTEEVPSTPITESKTPAEEEQVTKEAKAAPEPEQTPKEELSKPEPPKAEEPQEEAKVKSEPAESSKPTEETEPLVEQEAKQEAPKVEEPKAEPSEDQVDSKPLEEKKAAEPEEKPSEPVVEEKKPAVEEPVAPVTKTAEEEKPVEVEPTPVVEEKKPTEEKQVVAEAEKEEEEKTAETQPSPVVEERKPAVEETVVPEAKKVEELPAEPEPEPVVEQKKPAVEEPVEPKAKKVEEEKPVEPEPTPVVEDKKPKVEESAKPQTKAEEEPEKPEPAPVVEEKKAADEEKVVPEVKKTAEELPVESVPVAEEKKVVEEKKAVVEEKKAAVEEPAAPETKKVEELKPAEPEKKPAVEEPVVHETKKAEELKPAEPERKAAVEEPIVPVAKKAEEEPVVLEDKEEERTAKAKEAEEKSKFKPIPETEEGEIPIRAPHCLSDMNDVVVELGQLARFDCRIAAYPDPEITWLKDGNKVVPTDRYVLQNFHDDIFSLLIREVKKSDSGCYTCLARNEYGEAKSEALLNVLALKAELGEGDMAPSFVTKFGNVECIEGVPVEFTCQIKGRPPPTITWLINGREVSPSLEILTRQQEDNIMLAFRSVQLEHSGDVVCKLKNHLGEASCRAKLLVKEDLSKKGDIPLFEERPCDLEVTEGGEAMFECVVTGTPDPEVLWFFNGRELFDSRRRVIRKKGDKYQLILKEVIPDNAGVYTCKAVNAAGDASCAVELAVKEIPKEPRRRTAEAEEVEYSFPPTFTRRLLDQRVSPGRTARFECLMLGIPLPDVEWQKDGKKLEPSDKVRMGREGTTAILEIDNADLEDSGEYTCILTNDSGKATSRAGLSVQEERRIRYATPRLEARVPESVRAPSRGREDLEPPSRLARELTPEEKVPSLPFDKPHLLDIRDESVKLSWLPARMSGLPEDARHVTYTVEARELPSNRWMRLATGLESTYYVARHLRPNKEYMFRVYAENKYGPSDATLPATLAPREEPEERKRLYAHEVSPAPVHFPSTRPYVMDIGPETLRIGWHPAEKVTTLPPVSYRVEAQKLPSEDWIPLASRVHDTSLYLSDLEPDRDYNMRVRAQGPYGVTQPTAPMWLPRAAAFTGVPVSRPQITELEPDTVRLHWERVDVPSFTHEQDPLTYMIEMQEPPSMHWREVASHVPHTHYIVHDLEPGTDYRFRVRAQTVDGLRSEPSPATSIYRTLALSHAPIDRVEVTDYEPEYESVGLSWRRVEIPPFGMEDEPLLYMIECQEPQSDSWRSLVSGIPTTRYRVPDISPTADYRFRVRALTPYGVSPPSPAAGLYRSPTPSRPLASDLYLSSLEPESMRLSWQPLSLPSSRATTPAYQPLSYQVEAREYPSTQWRPLASDVRDTSYQLTGLAPTRDYSFRVRALTPGGDLTEPTSPVTVTSLPVRPRLPSREPSIKEMGVDSVHLQWPRAEMPYYMREAVPITYSVEMQEVPGYTWTPVCRGIPETSYVVKGLRADRDYRFRIRPETLYGPGEYSLPVHAYRKLSLSMPTREPMISDIGPNSVTLSWIPADVPAGAQTTRPLTYRVEMRESPSGHWTPVAERVPSTRVTINFLNPDKDYAFRVVAELDGVESEPTAVAYLPHRMGPPKMLREPPYISSVHPDSVLLCWRSVDIPARITDYAPVTYRIEAQEPPSMEWRPVARRIPCTHHLLSGLRPGQEYNFRVRAENDAGLSEPTPSVLLKRRSVPPTMPSHEPIVSDISPGSLRLSWRPAEVPSYLMDSLPVTYSIYYQHLPDMEWVPLARRVVGTNYHVTGLSPDNNYAFRVQAENQFGSSQPTQSARMPRLAEIPAPIYCPEIEEVEPSAIRLAWKTPRLGPYKKKKPTYAIETLEPDTWTWRPLVSNLTTPSYRVSTLSPSLDYVFRVRAEADKVLSEPSFPISYSRTRAPPSVPVERPILSETEPDSVLVTWHPLQYPSLGRGESSKRYKLEMKELPYGSWTSVLSQTPKWSHEVTGLRPNMDYAFRVSAVTDAGTSSPSNAAYLYRRPVIPRTPLEFPELADVADDAVSLRWKRVNIPAYEADDEPLSFLIEAQRLPSYDWEPVARGITDTSYRIKGLQPKQDYVFRVRGEMPSGVTTPSVPIPLYRRPERTGVPIRYVTVDDHNVPPYSARIRWKPVYLPSYTPPGSNVYQVEYRETPKRDWQTVGRDVKGTELTVPDLSPRKTYMFRVRAKSPAGELSDPSMSVPFYPLNVRAYESQPGREYVPYTDDYSLPNRPYINTLIVKVPPRMHIEKPNMYVTNPTTVHLTWNAARVPSATSQLSPTTYRVEVREDGTFNWMERASDVTGLGCDISGLDPQLDYAFRVRAVNDFGWSEATLPVFLHRPISLNYEEPDIDWEVISPAVPPLVPPRLPIDSPRITPVTGESLRLSWHPARIPAYARKSPITYVVEMKDPSGTAWAPVASKLEDTTYQVKGLEPTRPYLFRVRAESEFGSSEATLPAELSRTKPTAPRTRSQSVERQPLADYDLTARRGSFIDSLTTGVPPRVPAGRPAITNATETSLTLTWPAPRLPAYMKNTKLDFIIEYREASSRLWANLAENVPQTSYKVTGLDPEQDYMFRVRAHNDAGTSEPTLPATLERPKKKAATPQRRGSSVERRSLDRRSMDRMGSERRSLSRASLDRRSESRHSQREGRKKEGEDADTLPGMSPDDSPQAPEFSNVAEEAVQYGVESHPMTISLQLRGYPPPEVTWYHQGKKLELGDRYDTYITPTGQVFLEFLNMGWEDIGDYRCVAENELGTAEKTVKIDVADPPTFIEPLQDVTVVERGQGTLSCCVDGIPYPSVRFMKDWRPLTDTSRLVVTNDPKQADKWNMTINNAIQTDSGSYMCVAENVAGKVFSTSRVNVEDDSMASQLPVYKDSNLEDNYYVLQDIGRGRHGRVRRVIEKSSGKEFAAKFIQVRDAVDKEFFRSELDMLSKQNHKNIVSVHDAYETPRQLIVVMELLDGGELLDGVVRDGQWTEGKAAGVIKQLLETLQHVHSHGVVHMDVKPSNLLLSGDKLDSAKLIDFGLARKLSPSEDTFLNHGTPGFTSPEALDVKPVSTASDVWGVGVLAYILLGGQSPFQADNTVDSLKKTQACDWSFDVCKPFSSASQDAKDFISKILQKNPDDRPTVDECLAHPWLKKTDGGASIDVALIKDFQDRDKKQRQATAARTMAYLRTLQRQMTGGEVSEKGLRPAVDPKTGTVSFPDIEAYGEFLDSESWYEWQSRYGQGPDSGLVPLKDPEYTARIRGYKRSMGSVDDAALPFDDDAMTAAEREKYKMMKERRRMADIDKEEIPPSLEKELQWLEERKQARKAREPQRQGSVDSRRSSISTEGEGPVPVFRQRLQDLSFETGDTITMYCALEGPPPYSTVWYKNEELLSDGTRVKQELYEDGQATLTITAAKPYDAGVYKCVARSKSGRASSRMRLLQGDVPERPGRPAVVQTAAQEVVLIWEAPRFDGNCPILYYRVDYKAAGDSRWTTSVYTPLENCVVSGLKPETAYRLRVSAANLLGRGPFSWSSVEVTTSKQGSISSLTTGDLTLDQVKQKQEEGKEMAAKPRETDTAEEAPTDTAAPTLQTTEPNKEYALGDTLWQGQFGEMKEATSKKTSKRCLVKCVPTSLSDSQHEFDVLKTLRHETVLRLLAGFSTKDTLFMVLEDVPGIHVAQRLSLRRRFSEDCVAYIIRQALYGLQFLHRNSVIHLNLQPSALMLTSPQGLNIKLADFSLAHTLSNGADSVAVPRKGYPDFIAPEVVVKDKASPASDVWAVGTLTFLLLSGLSPFSGSSDEETLINVAYSRYDAGDLLDGVSNEALKFLFKVMKRLPRNRPSVQECLEHKWLQLTDAMMKTREVNLFRSNRLRQFVLNYDTKRQSKDFCFLFDDLVLPPELVATLQADVLTAGKK